MSREILEECISAHIQYAADRPWMKKPNPITIDVLIVQEMLSKIDAQNLLIKRSRNVLSQPATWADENKQARLMLVEELAAACA